MIFWKTSDNISHFLKTGKKHLESISGLDWRPRGLQESFITQGVGKNWSAQRLIGIHIDAASHAFANICVKDPVSGSFWLLKITNKMFHLVYIFPILDFFFLRVIFSVSESSTLIRICCSCWAGCVSLCTHCVVDQVWPAWHIRPSIPVRQIIKHNQPYMGLFGALTQKCPLSTVCVMIVFVFTIHWLFSKVAPISESLRWGHLAQCIQVRLQTVGLNPGPFLMEVNQPNHCPALTQFSCVFAVVFSQGDLSASQHERRSVFHHQ